VQRVARGHHRFQEQVAVVAAHVAVAQPRVAQHQVQAGVAGAARELAVVQAEHGDHAERDRALGHHAAEGDAAEQEALALGRGGEPLAQHFAHHGEVEFGIEPAVFGFGDGRADHPAQQAQRLAPGMVAGVDAEQSVEQQLQPRGPGRSAARLRGIAMQRRQFLQQAVERAERGGLRAVRAGNRRQLAVGQGGDGVLAHHVAGQQAVHAPGEGVLLDAGHAEGLAPVAVQAPGHARLAQPLAEQVHRAFVQAERGGDRRRLQEVQHLRRGEARLRRVEQAVERGEQRVHARHRHVGQVVGQRPVRAAGFAEHRRQQRHVGADVRGHHHDVGRLQRGVTR